MPSVHVNTPFHNEGWLFKETLKNWYWYNVDEFVFVDDNSTDDSVDVIKESLGNRATIIKSSNGAWHESGVRSAAWEYSRSKGADVLISLDADELLSNTLSRNWGLMLQDASVGAIYCPQLNIVDNTFARRRNDPAYANNIRDFIHPMKYSGKFANYGAYHSPRCPNSASYGGVVAECSFFHLQSANVKYYALKQLWYKVFEFINYGYSPEHINGRYDSVVNGLDFQPVDVLPEYYSGLRIDFGIFERRIKDDQRFRFLAEQHKALKDNVEYQKLITFGKDILEEYCNSI